ncbi:MAG: 16S rRNA (guanine(527)-N(7))-methyltransferase RsmG [Micavibrio sp.]
MSPKSPKFPKRPKPPKLAKLAKPPKAPGPQNAPHPPQPLNPPDPHRSEPPSLKSPSSKPPSSEPLPSGQVPSKQLPFDPSPSEQALPKPHAPEPQGPEPRAAELRGPELRGDLPVSPPTLPFSAGLNNPHGRHPSKTAPAAPASGTGVALSGNPLSGGPLPAAILGPSGAACAGSSGDFSETLSEISSEASFAAPIKAALGDCAEGSSGAVPKISAESSAGKSGNPQDPASGKGGDKGAAALTVKLVSGTPPVFVSQETLDRLRLYQALLIKWQAKINLVSPNTVQESWERHFIDSAQLAPLIPASVKTIADLGAGAGFAGMVLAIMRPDLAVTFIESDSKKCAFLAAVSRETGAKVTVINKRIEAAIPALPAPDLVTARALAPLPALLAYVAPWLEKRPDISLLFPKGAQFQAEITAAQAAGWAFDVTATQSRTEKSARILRLDSVQKTSPRP